MDPIGTGPGSDGSDSDGDGDRHGGGNDEAGLGSPGDGDGVSLSGEGVEGVDGGNSVVPDRSDVLTAVRIVAMSRRHLGAVIAVEEECYVAPWSKTLFLSELAQRESRRYVVAGLGPMVVGYSGLMQVLDEGHITTMSVSPRWQGQGLGTLLMLDLARAALGKGLRNMTLEVRTGNDAAQALYRKFGFAPVGIRKGYYPETGEDAIVMWAYDIDTPQYVERLDRLDAELRSA